MARIIYDYKVEKIIDHTEQIRELFLSLQNGQEFKFRAGQFAMLHVPVAGSEKPALRAYSIASPEQDSRHLKLIFKHVENGLASNFVWALKGGETLQFTGPFGKVFFQEPPTEQIVFLNTGSGISQHLCYIESFMQKYPDQKYIMYIGLRYEKDVYYQKELAELKTKVPHLNYHYVLSRPTEQWSGKKGYVQHFLKEVDYKNIPTTFYLCGNGGMIKEVKHQLLEVDGFDKTKLWTEAFD